MYDFIIIGGGPCGLTIANILSKQKYKILIVDKNNNLGGCHSVHRVNGLFSEHSPRVYTNSYLNFINVLKDMNINFYDLFTEYNFGFFEIFKILNKYISIREYTILLFAYINLNEDYKKITVLEFMNKYNFSKEVCNIIDGICRTIDGVGIDKFLLYSLFNMILLPGLYKFYIPKYSNDIKLFKLWKEYLLNNNVDILLNSSISNIDKNYIIVNDTQFYSKKFIFACPPSAICDILKKSKYPYIFGDIYNWTTLTSYNKHISFTFHYNQDIKLPHLWGGEATSKTEYGIIYIIMSDYMKFNDDRSKTVISITLSKPPQNTTNIINETYNQLKNIFNNLPYPDNVVFGNIISDSFASTKYGYMNYKSEILDNYYTCGHHIGHSNFEYNTLESAVSNALYLCKELTNKDIIIHEPIKLINIIKIIMTIVIIIIIKKAIGT